MTGYGVFWSIIEDLYNNDNSLEAEYDDIAYDLRVDAAIVKSIVNDFGLFQFDAGSFGSTSVQRRLEERAEKSEKARQSINKRWNKSNDTNTNVLKNHTNVSVSDSNVILERKGKEIKEIKEGNKGAENGEKIAPPILERIVEEFKEAHGHYIVTDPDAELSAAAKILSFYREKYPAAGDDVVIEGMRYLFKKYVNINDDFLRHKMSLPTIAKNWNEINSKVFHGKATHVEVAPRNRNDPAVLRQKKVMELGDIISGAVSQ